MIGYKIIIKEIQQLYRFSENYWKEIMNKELKSNLIQSKKLKVNGFNKFNNENQKIKK